MIPGCLAYPHLSVGASSEAVVEFVTSITNFTSANNLYPALAGKLTNNATVRIKVASGVAIYAAANTDSLYLPKTLNGFTIAKWIIENDGYILGGGGTPNWDASGNPGRTAILAAAGNNLEIVNNGIIGGGGGAGGTDDAAKGKWGGGGAPNGGYGATMLAGGPRYLGGGAGGEGGAPGVAGHASYVNSSRAGGAAGAAIKAESGTITVVYVQLGDIRGSRPA